uniref:Uncharacterized protein n=1 Tax=Romanomermis culicivorax TaxID=13658 RepID=A0A915JP06_ROMCU
MAQLFSADELNPILSAIIEPNHTDIRSSVQVYRMAMIEPPTRFVEFGTIRTTRILITIRLEFRNSVCKCATFNDKTILIYS